VEITVSAISWEITSIWAFFGKLHQFEHSSGPRGGVSISKRVLIWFERGARFYERGGSFRPRCAKSHSAVHQHVHCHNFLDWGDVRSQKRWKWSRIFTWMIYSEVRFQWSPISGKSGKKGKSQRKQMSDLKKKLDKNVESMSAFWKKRIQISDNCVKVKRKVRSDKKRKQISIIVIRSQILVGDVRSPSQKNEEIFFVRFQKNWSPISKWGDVRSQYKWKMVGKWEERGAGYNPCRLWSDPCVARRLRGVESPSACRVPVFACSRLTFTEITE